MAGWQCTGYPAWRLVLYRLPAWRHQHLCPVGIAAARYGVISASEDLAARRLAYEIVTQLAA